MPSTPAPRLECPRCRALAEPPGQFCRQCGAALAGAPTTDPALNETAPVESIGDRRLTDSNQAWLGKIVDGRYRVIEVIGRGGMGVVYRVQHLRMGKIAAMKVLHRDLAQDPDVVERFEREAAAVSRLHHPHTVQVFDFGNTAGNLYLIMEYVRGLDLGRLVVRDGPLTWARAAPLLLQICGALQEAHERGIVHRDLKPENILITRTTAGRDYAKVLDFGLAKLDQRGAPSRATDKQAIVGTPYFMAPEQIRGDEVDARTDLYSFGALIFEILTGTHLYTSTSAIGVLTKHLTGDPDAPSMRAPQMGIPPAVDHLCHKALARDPAERWTSAAELAAAIEEIYAETVTEATGSRSAASRGLRGGQLTLGDEYESDVRLRRSDLDLFERGLRRRRRVVITVATMCALGVVGAAAWFVTRPPPLHRTEQEPNDDVARATRIAAGTEVTGLLGKRASPHDGDRDSYVVKWPSGSRRIVSVAVTAPPNIDVHLSINDGVHTTAIDEGRVGEGEVLHRRGVDGSVTVIVSQTMTDGQRYPVENVSDRYTLIVTEEDPAAGEREPNGTEADATLIAPTVEMRGYLDTRDDVDLLRWTGPEGNHTVIVRADGLPLVWRLADGKPRTPGAATVKLGRGEVIRIERSDRSGTGTLPGRDVAWSIAITP